MLDKVEIKQRYDSDGLICEVKVNGQEVKRCRSVRYECEAGSIPFVTLELYADIDIDTEADVLILHE